MLDPLNKLNYTSCQAYCRSLHPYMALAEMEEPGEYTAVITDYMITPSVRGNESNNFTNSKMISK